MTYLIRILLALLAAALPLLVAIGINHRNWLLVSTATAAYLATLTLIFLTRRTRREPR